MAGDIDAFLDDARGSGSSDSEGGFTVNFAKAREKMAKYQLVDPHEFVIKLVQAGVLNTCAMEFDFEKALVIRYRGWPAELTLEKVSEQLCGGALGACETPLEHLAVGLNALVGEGRPGVKLTLGDVILKIDEDLSWDENEPALEEGVLEITVPRHSALEWPKIWEQLYTRCSFAPIPIVADGRELTTHFPITSGSHRPKYFRENKIVASRGSNGGRELFLEPGGEGIELRLTVDLDPQATICLAKAGVLIEQKKIDLGVPGMIGVVQADELRTDLTGVQVLVDEKYEELTARLREEAKELLKDALRATAVVGADSQPISPRGRVSYGDGCAGCSMALLGTFATCSGWGDGLIGDGSLMPAIFFWISFPGIWVFQSAYRKGSEKNEGSDEEAKQLLYDRLLDAANSLGVQAL